MRHAKSDWNNPKLSDADRPLNKRGKKAAIQIGQWLQDNNLVPNFVLCSTATRTRETLGQIRLCTNIDNKDIKYDESLYLSTLDSLLHKLKTAPWDKEKIMLLGHNPELEELLSYLCGDDIALSKTGKLFPTASIAVIELNNEITQLGGQLKSLVRPKEL